MKNNKTKIIVACLVALLLVVLGFLSAVKPDRSNTSLNETYQQTQTNSSTSPESGANTQNLSGVNSEENNTLLSQAGIPYEDNDIALTYKADNLKPSGVTILALNKTPVSRNMSDFKDYVGLYFKNRMIDVNQISVEYSQL